MDKIKKVVINKCYGGFGLSTEAMKRLIAMGSEGITVSHYDDDLFSRKDERRDVGDGYTVGWIEDMLFKGNTVLTYDELLREDKDLIQVVEELGEAANGNYAYLSIVEIPDDIEYTIEEYDGLEHIAEKHRTWG